jgi:hypothetical protein
LPSGQQKRLSSNIPQKSSLSETFVRHGPGDGVIKLNVGGTEFVTLRSTVESNVVLSEYVARAQANGESLDKSVFIDRDPQHFGLILAFLRNKIEGIAYNTNYSKMGIKTLSKKPKYLRLPDDEGVMQDLFVEAQHYQIKELQSQLCEASFLTLIFSRTGGNPFEAVQNFVKYFRRVSLTLVGSGGIMTAMLQDFDWLKNLLPWSNKETEKLSDKEKAEKTKDASTVSDAEPSIAG